MGERDGNVISLRLNGVLKVNETVRDLYKQHNQNEKPF
jgi:RNA polymerase-interacting CarD/CdnL/TRCF family regulator